MARNKNIYIEEDKWGNSLRIHGGIIKIKWWWGKCYK